VNVISATLELVDVSGGLVDPVEEGTPSPLRLVDPTGAAVGAFGDPDEGQEPDWQERALCAQTDPEAFFPEKGGSTREAKRICSGCEVRAECLEYALAHDERFGIWGGLSERERRRLRRAI
jgi:WhiB family transcriptional regulator, redox-sensing transcriptional regulator